MSDLPETQLRPGAYVSILVLPPQAHQAKIEEATWKAVGEETLHRGKRRTESAVPRPGRSRTTFSFHFQRRVSSNGSLQRRLSVLTLCPSSSA